MQTPEPKYKSFKELSPEEKELFKKWMKEEAQDFCDTCPCLSKDGSICPQPPEKVFQKTLHI